MCLLDLVDGGPSANFLEQFGDQVILPVEAREQSSLYCVCLRATPCKRGDLVVRPAIGASATADGLGEHVG